jgi:hypothetical protein
LQDPEICIAAVGDGLSNTNLLFRQVANLKSLQYIKTSLPDERSAFMSVIMVKILSDRQNIHLQPHTEATNKNLCISHNCTQEISDPVLIEKWVDAIKASAAQKYR